MTMHLANNWWSLLIRGLAAIALGILTLLWPGLTFAALVILFGAYALVDGIANVIGAVRASKGHERWGFLLVEGLVGIAAGIVTFAWPAITALALVFVVAAWAAVTGVFEIAAAIHLRKYIAGEVLLVLSGIASIVLGILLFAAPAAGALAIALWVGVYALIFGALEVALSFRLRSFAAALRSGAQEPPFGEAGRHAA